MRKRDNKGRFVTNKKAGQYGFVNLAAYTSPEIKEVKGKQWIEYGEDNNYFQYLIDRYNTSPTNNAAINGVSQAIYGKGLNALDSSTKPNEYAQMVSLFKKEMVRKLCYDLKLMGQCAIQVIYTKDRKKIAQLEHFPVETLRAEKMNDEGIVPAYYYWKDWATIRMGDEPLRIPAYGTSKEAIEIYYIRPYKPSFYYYSPVDYQGCLQYAELESEISNYHINNIKSGLSPTMMISFNNGIPNQQERQLLESKIAQKFTGSSNAGKFILAFNDSKEQEATLTPVQLSDAHNQYQFLSDESSSKILVGHRIVSPFLLGIRTATGFSSNADEIKNASILMDNSVIRPFQELLIDCFDHLLAYNDISLKLYFTTLQPLEFTDVDTSIQSKEEIEEETGIEMSKVELDKVIDGKQAYDTKEEAIAIAEANGCGGYHEHEVEGVTYYMPCEDHDTALKKPCWDGYEQYGTKIKDGKEVPNCVKMATTLSKEEEFNVIGSLQESAKSMGDEWVVVDEADADHPYSNEDWANYLIKEKPKSILSRIRKAVSLVGATDYNVGSVNNGSEPSRLDSKNGLYKIRYKYARGMSGDPSKSRGFCKKMMQLTQLGVVWRIEDIDNASYAADVNVQFRHKPSLRYDIFTLKGGIYCQHKWVKVLYRLASNTEVSDNLGNYNKTRTIPKSYIKNPVGSKKAAIPTDKQSGRGKYPS
jgi:hypothetical protein